MLYVYSEKSAINLKSLIKKSGLSYKWSLEESGLSDDKILQKMVVNMI